ncbi:MAG: CsgG/HfaB family protein [Balneolaceae bacterium]|nr:CsgG/HfaB family protein [Balneolaceae bacterium]
MPDPQSKVVAAVYRFRDQTGQYKAKAQGASWSTAVTQGATSILIESMEDSGWFTPIEREGVSNLLNERQIIQQTRQQNGQPSNLPPLLYAGVILEGGIIGYDTNVITAGGGLRYLGTGGSGQYRKDQVTIYLRAVSTQTGRVMKTVHTTKSIISQELKSGAFRFVDTQRLLEAEAGFTYNEPPVMAVTEAIDEAVKTLVVEGVEDGLWSPSDTTAYNDYKQKYHNQKERERQAEADYFGLMEDHELRSGFDLTAQFTTGSHIGSYPSPYTRIGGGLQAEQFLSSRYSLGLNLQRSSIGARNAFSEPFSSADLMLNTYLLPTRKFSPYLGVGGGVLAYDDTPDFADRQFYPAVSATAGIDYRISRSVGVQLGFNYRYLMQDGVDGVTLGTINDQQWNITAGISINPDIF